VGLEQDIQRSAISILNEAESEKITAGKSPSGLAAAALYVACVMNDTKCTQKDIAFAAGVTEVTIRNRYKDLVQELELKIGKMR
jgi:transcription initiation factor TFIIB